MSATSSSSLSVNYLLLSRVIDVKWLLYRSPFSQVERLPLPPLEYTKFTSSVEKKYFTSERPCKFIYACFHLFAGDESALERMWFPIQENQLELQPGR